MPGQQQTTGASTHCTQHCMKADNAEVAAAPPLHHYTREATAGPQPAACAPVVDVCAGLAVGEAVEEPPEAQALALLLRLANRVLEVAEVLLAQLHLLLDAMNALGRQLVCHLAVRLDGAAIGRGVEEEAVAVAGRARELVQRLARLQRRPACASTVAADRERPFVQCRACLRMLACLMCTTVCACCWRQAALVLLNGQRQQRNSGQLSSSAASDSGAPRSPGRGRRR
jgi:hypothetical protein